MSVKRSDDLCIGEPYDAVESNIAEVRSVLQGTDSGEGEGSLTHLMQEAEGFLLSSVQDGLMAEVDRFSLRRHEAAHLREQVV